MTYNLFRAEIATCTQGCLLRIRSACSQFVLREHINLAFCLLAIIRPIFPSTEVRELQWEL